MRLLILGPLSVSGGPPLTGGQQARVLGALALEAGRPVSSTSLAAWALGPERDLDVAQVQVLVSRLRRELRACGLPASIDTVPGGYRLSIPPDAVDASVFERHVSAAAGHSEPGPIRAELAAALGLWRGEVLEGLGLEPHPEVRRLGEVRLIAIERALTLDVQLGGAGAAVPELLDTCQRHPHRERLRALAMAALYLAGRQTDALALFHEGRRVLISGLGIEPGEELRLAEACVLRHDLGPLLERIAGPALAGRGRGSGSGSGQAASWVPDAGRSGATGSGDRSHPSPGPAEFDLRRRGTLPAYRTSFVGRRRSAADLAAALEGSRLVTVVGPGGVGKTRLVCEVLAAANPTAPGSVRFADLATFGPGDAFDATVAEGIGVRVRPGQTPIDAMAEAFGGPDRGTLVLDSCETVAAQAAALARELLDRCPGLRIVATSWVPLHLPSEQVWALAPLEPASEAPELYTHRAVGADPGYRPEAEAADAVARLCERLDGLPLAIELAAARARTVTATELLRHLDQRFALLRSDTAAPPDRHRSLEATMAWSYRLLDDDQRRLLRRMAVFTGPVDLAAIEAVCTAADLPSRALLRALPELVDRSLVATRRAGAGTRFRLLDTVRAFAYERLRHRGVVDRLRRRHAEHFAGRLDRLRHELRGPAEAAAVAELDELWGEVRAAVRWATDRSDADLAARLVAGLGFEAVFRERGEVVDWAALALALPGAAAVAPADELAGTSALADWAFGHFDRGLARAEDAVRLHRARATAMCPDVAAALPLHLSLRGDLDRSLAVMAEHSAEAARDGCRYAEAHTTICTAMGLAFGGRRAESACVLAQADALAADVGSPLLLAIAAFTRAIMVLDDDPAEAAVHAGRCLDLAAEVRATWFLTAGANYLTAARVRSAEPVEALDELNATLARLERGASVQSAANTIRNAVALLDRLGRGRDALPLVGWLGVNRPSIPGSPGMRNHPGELASRLRDELGEAEVSTAMNRGAALLLDGAVRLALELLEPAVPR